MSHQDPNIENPTPEVFRLGERVDKLIEMRRQVGARNDKLRNRYLAEMFRIRARLIVLMKIL